MTMRKLGMSFVHAFNGLKRASRERNLRIHCVAAALVLSFGWFIGLAMWEWTLLCVAIGMVLTAEVINTAIEELANVVRDEHKLHYSATRHTRDMAAGAVLLASIAAAIIGLLVFVPHFIG
jgi:diacylglycerol kinase